MGNRAVYRCRGGFMNSFDKRLVSMSIVVSSSVFIPSSVVFATVGNRYVSSLVSSLANSIRLEKSASRSAISGLRRSIRKPTGDVTTSKFAHSYYKSALDLFNQERDIFNSKISKSSKIITLEEGVSLVAVKKVHLEGYTLVESTGGVHPNIRVINEQKEIPEILDGKITARGFIGESSRNNGVYDLVKVKDVSDLSFRDNSEQFTNKFKEVELKFKENFPNVFSDRLGELSSTEKSLLLLSKMYSNRLDIESLTNEDLISGSDSSKNAHTLFKAELIVGNSNFIRWVREVSKERLLKTDRKLLMPLLDKIWSNVRSKNTSSSESDVSTSSVASGFSERTLISSSRSRQSSGTYKSSSSSIDASYSELKAQSQILKSDGEKEGDFYTILSELKELNETAPSAKHEDSLSSSSSDVDLKSLESLDKSKLEIKYKTIRSMSTFSQDLSSIEEEPGAFSIGDRSSLKLNSRKLSRLDSMGRITLSQSEEEGISSTDSSASFQSLKDGEPSFYDKGYIKIPGTDSYMEKMIYKYMDREGFLTLYVEEQEQKSKVVEVSPRVYSYVVPEEQQSLFENMKKDLVVEAKNKLGQSRRVVIQKLTKEEDSVEGIYAYQLDQGVWREVVLSQSGSYYLGDVVKYDGFEASVQGKLRKLAKLYNTFGAPVVGAAGGISRAVTGIF